MNHLLSYCITIWFRILSIKLLSMSSTNTYLSNIMNSLELLVKNSKFKDFDEKQLAWGKVILASSLSSIASYYLWQRWIGKHLILNQNIEPSRYEYNKTRKETDPFPIPNTWYQLCYADELSKNTIKEIQALGQAFILWRDENNQPVCQDAYCIHLGANISAGGVADSNEGCIQCPFHRWKFNKRGEVIEIPYNKEPHNCNISKKLYTYPCVEWCGIIMVYYHADNESPSFELANNYIEQDLKNGNYFPFLRWDIGIRSCTLTDWMDQSGDHAHFSTLHGDFLIPYTLLPIPKWIQRIFPLAICHNLATFRGDDLEWEKIHQETGLGAVDKNLYFFRDIAGLTWNGKVIEKSVATTLETYVGPGFLVFHIPYQIGTIKVFFSYTPVEGGTLMRVQTFLDGSARWNPFKQLLAWVLTGISVSQLEADTVILEKKIRLKKPILQAVDGPWGKGNHWIKQFFSESSFKRPTYIKNDW